MIESHHSLERAGLSERRLDSDFQGIKLGTSMEDVVKIVGDPDTTYQVPFGGEMLTAWVYRTDDKPLRMWFDSNGKLRLKNR